MYIPWPLSALVYPTNRLNDLNGFVYRIHVDIQFTEYILLEGDSSCHVTCPVRDAHIMCHIRVFHMIPIIHADMYSCANTLPGETGTLDHTWTACIPVLPFPKLNKIFFGYFDPENILIDNENNEFSG